MTRLATGDGVGYEVREAGDGPPVLLLHGFTGSAASWAALLQPLTERHRVIAVDLLGHGGSDAPADPARHAVERQAADLADLLQQLDATRGAVLGYSFGARIALRLALDDPETVERLILESPSAGIADAGARAARRAADERWATLLETDGLDAFADAWEAQPLFASRQRLPDDDRRRLREALLGNRAAGLAASLRGAGQGAMEFLYDRLPEVRQPTLVLAGALDTVGRERAEAVATGIPGARFETIPDAGHAPHLETPAAFLARVLAFLATPVEVAS